MGISSAPREGIIHPHMFYHRCTNTDDWRFLECVPIEAIVLAHSSSIKFLVLNGGLDLGFRSSSFEKNLNKTTAR